MRSTNRREALSLRVDSMRAVVEQCVNLDAATITAELTESVHHHIATPRLMPRLAMRRARRLAAGSLFSPIQDEHDSMILAGGADAIEALSLAVGVHVHWSEIVRMVRRVDTESLDAALGLPSRTIALRGRASDFGVPPLHEGDDAMELIERVRRDGALSWACWLAARDPASARRLRVLTPCVVTDLLPPVLPANAEDRANRRLVVDAEISAMMIATQADEREVA